MYIELAELTKEILAVGFLLSMQTLEENLLPGVQLNTDSIWHLELQPSPLIILPSSH